ncbi:Tetracycline resistance protein, TetA/multidrug resistance protein MdtG [Pseudohyphozyma bogoriensis]|nr:Tetracycline resistance protein, TetA/multidrug resistance protein MdtG [Pseudohyphozyma bogoriensis]
MSDRSALAGRATGLIIFVLLGALAITDLVLTSVLIHDYNSDGFGWPTHALLVSHSDRRARLGRNVHMFRLYLGPHYDLLVRPDYGGLETRYRTNPTPPPSRLGGSSAFSYSRHHVSFSCGSLNFLHCGLLRAIEGVSWTNFGVGLICTPILFIAGTMYDRPPRHSRDVEVRDAGVAPGVPLRNQPNPYLASAERPVVPYVEPGPVGPGYTEPMPGAALDGRMGPYPQA